MTIWAITIWDKSVISVPDVQTAAIEPVLDVVSLPAPLLPCSPEAGVHLHLVTVVTVHVQTHSWFKTDHHQFLSKSSLSFLRGHGGVCRCWWTSTSGCWCSRHRPWSPRWCSPPGCSRHRPRGDTHHCQDSGSGSRGQERESHKAASLLSGRQRYHSETQNMEIVKHEFKFYSSVPQSQIQAENLESPGFRTGILSFDLEMGSPCDFNVSPSPFGLEFGTLDFGTSYSDLTISFNFNPCYKWRKYTPLTMQCSKFFHAKYFLFVFCNLLKKDVYLNT